MVVRRSHLGHLGQREEPVSIDVKGLPQLLPSNVLLLEMALSSIVSWHQAGRFQVSADVHLSAGQDGLVEG